MNKIENFSLYFEMKLVKEEKKKETVPLSGGHKRKKRKERKQRPARRVHRHTAKTAFFIAFPPGLESIWKEK